MVNYEGLFILSGDLHGEQLEKEVDFLKNEIVKVRGEISEAKLLGKRRLAYPIKKLKEGVFVLVNFQSLPGSIDEIQKKVSLNTLVLRSGIFKKGKENFLNEIRD